MSTLDRLRRCLPAFKLLLAAAVLVFVGRQFAIDLQRPELYRRAPNWTCLAAAAVLYLAGLSFSALIWRRLLARLGPTPPLFKTFRAYFIGHLGKYVPGKAWALVLRADLVRGAGVKPGLAALTAFYEVLVTMASGALSAALLFTTFAPHTGLSEDEHTVAGLLRFEAGPGKVIGRTTAVGLALGLLTPLLLVVWPPLFNRLLRRLRLPFRDHAGDRPRFLIRDLLDGLLLSSIGWLFLSASLAAVLFSLVGLDQPWDLAFFGRLPALLAVSYVAGFVILLAPAGLGVREFFLVAFLAPELETLLATTPDDARGLAVLATLILRMTWTTAELLVAAAVYPIRAGNSYPDHARPAVDPTRPAPGPTSHV